MMINIGFISIHLKRTELLELSFVVHLSLKVQNSLY